MCNQFVIVFLDDTSSICTFLFVYLPVVLLVVYTIGTLQEHSWTHSSEISSDFSGFCIKSQMYQSVEFLIPSPRYKVYLHVCTISLAKQS